MAKKKFGDDDLKAIRDRVEKERKKFRLHAMLCGGTGTAILVSGPIGLIGGAILALVVAYLTVRHGKEKAAKLAENWEAPAWIIKRALTQSKIHKAREAFRSKLEEKLRQETKPLQDEFETRIRKITEQQIEGLSEITQL